MALKETKPRYGFHMVYVNEVTIVFVEDARLSKLDYTDIPFVEGFAVVKNGTATILSDPHSVLMQKGVKRDMESYASKLEIELEDGGDELEVFPSVRLSKALGKAIKNQNQAFLDPDI